MKKGNEKSKKRKVNSLYLPNVLCCSDLQSDQVDFISQLSDDVLVLILSRVPTEEAIRTSVASKRWEHLWKKLPHLVLNTRSRMLSLSEDDSNPDTELTRIINNHYGDLKSCEITHSANEKGLLETWIQTVETRNLTLANTNIRLPLCSFPVDLFSPHSKKLSSLSLKLYALVSSSSCSIPFFQNNKNYYWPNIKTLKLHSICAPDVGVFHNFFASCPSLEVLLLKHIYCTGTPVGRRSFEIKNSTLKFLELYSVSRIDELIVSAPNLDILVAKDVFYCNDFLNPKFFLRSPNLQQFNLNSSNACLHIVYNISEGKNNGHEELLNRIGGELRGETYLSLSVAVDLNNETQVERFRQVMSLVSSDNRLRDLSIKFKGNNSSSNPSEEEVDSWQTNKKFCLGEDESFQRMWMYNFKGSKEEIAFVSCLIRQCKVQIRIMINNSKSFSACKVEEAALAKLLEEVQSEGQKKVTIECVRDCVCQEVRALVEEWVELA